jgi:hypothetical protein
LTELPHGGSYDKIMPPANAVPWQEQSLAEARQSPFPPVWIPPRGSSEAVARAADSKRKGPFLVTFRSADHLGAWGASCHGD